MLKKKEEEEGSVGHDCSGSTRSGTEWTDHPEMERAALGDGEPWRAKAGLQGHMGGKV